MKLLLRHFRRSTPKPWLRRVRASVRCKWSKLMAYRGEYAVPPLFSRKPRPADDDAMDKSPSGGPGGQTSTIDRPPSSTSALSLPMIDVSRVDRHSLTREEVAQLRADCIERLRQGVNDPFGECAGLRHDSHGEKPWHDMPCNAVEPGKFGITFPSDAEFHLGLHSLLTLHGLARLCFIRDAFSMPPATTVLQIEQFLDNNLGIISALCFRRVHSANSVSMQDEIRITDPESEKQRELLLQAILELDWVAEDVAWVVKLVRNMTPENKDTLLSIFKTMKPKTIMPHVRVKMFEHTEWYKDEQRWEKTAVMSMRAARPNSLIRNEVKPEDVVVHPWSL